MLLRPLCDTYGGTFDDIMLNGFHHGGLDVALYKERNMATPVSKNDWAQLTYNEKPFAKLTSGSGSRRAAEGHEQQQQQE